MPHKYPLALHFLCITSFLVEHYQVMKAFNPGWAHHETSNHLLSPLKSVYHLQWLSLHLMQNFKSLDRTEGPIPCPNPLDIVNKIQIQEKWEPNLSATFWDRYGLCSFISFHSGSLKDNCTAATDMSFISGGSSLGIGTHGGPPTGGSDETKATNTRLDNTHFNSSLFGAYKFNSVKSAALRKKVADGTIGPLPMSKVGSTMPMYLAWHTKGLCNSTCPSAHNHIVYSTTEYAPIVKWCKEEGYKSE